MKTRLLTLLAMASICFTSCGDEEPIDLNLQFKLEYGGEPLVMFEEVEYPDGKLMNFSRFSFYISDLKLNDQVIKSDPELLDLTADHTSLEKAQTGLSYGLSNVTDTDITSISFNIGIPESINATKPADYTSDNDLSIAEEYWSPWDSYIFSKTEGRIDSDGDGSMEKTVALHLGLNEAFRTVNLDADFSINAETKSADIIIDLKKLFEGPNGIYDIIAVSQIHQTNTMDQINELADNMVEAFSVR